MRKRNSGFKLIEVAVILGILFAFVYVLMPDIFRDHRTPAERASCQSNLKEIGREFAQYIQDNNGYFMPQTTSYPSPKRGWVAQLRPYSPGGTDANIFICPTAKREGVPALNDVTTYYMNNDLYSWPDAKVLTHKQTILAGEGDWGPSYYACYELDQCIGTDPRGASVRVSHQARTRHLGGADYLFADGHVKWLLPTTARQLLYPKGPL